jgi:hypothetical protein
MMGGIFGYIDLANCENGNSFLLIVLNGLRLGNSITDDERTVGFWISEHLGSNIKTEKTMLHDTFSFILWIVSRSHVYEVIIEPIA